MAFQAGPETLARTNLGDLRPGSPVNLERALARGRPAGRAFRQRPHRRHRHLARAARPRRLVHLLVLAPPRAEPANGLQGLDRRGRRQPDDRRQRAGPLQRGPDPLHPGRHHAGPAGSRRQGEPGDRHPGQVRPAAGRGAGSGSSRGQGSGAGTREADRCGFARRAIALAENRNEIHTAMQTINTKPPSPPPSRRSPSCCGGSARRASGRRPSSARTSSST